MLRWLRRDGTKMPMAGCIAQGAHTERHLNDRWCLRPTCNGAAVLWLDTSHLSHACAYCRWLTLAATAAVAVLCTGELHASSDGGDMPPPPTGDAASNSSEVPPTTALTAQDHMSIGNSMSPM